MKIGYPCQNLTVGCSSARTFRLKSYSEERLIETVRGNLDCLLIILKFNVAHDLLFFRITSDLVPFASHPVCQLDWAGHFQDRFQEIGDFIRSHEIRVSMHPDQFTLINSPDTGVFERSAAELLYHARVLDAMGLDSTAKVQFHVGGVYGDRARSMDRFARRLRDLPRAVTRRLAIENDDRSYTLKDCLGINAETGLPVIFDVLHHEANSSGETPREAVTAAAETWRDADGIPMVDYSSQRAAGRTAAHTGTLDPRHFESFLAATAGHDIDVMLEIKDKERSAIAAVELARGDKRFRGRV